MPSNNRHQIPVDYYDEKDNPFRPEGELAKEAEEFVQKLKEKQEHDINQILNATVSSTTPLPSPNSTLTVGAVNIVNEQQSPIKKGVESPSISSTSSPSKQSVKVDAPTTLPTTPTKTATTTPTSPVKSSNDNKTPTTNPAVNKQKEAAASGEKKKTKPKCGCTIS